METGFPAEELGLLQAAQTTGTEESWFDFPTLPPVH